MELVYNYATHPTLVYEKVKETRPLKLAIIIVILAALSNNLFGAVILEKVSPLFSSRFDFSFPPYYYPTHFVKFALFSAPIIGLLSWLIWSLILAGVTKLLFRPAEGDWRTLVITLGLSQSPTLLLAPLAILGLILTTSLSNSSLPGFSALASICSLGISIWVLVLQILSLKLTYVISIGQAIIAFLLPLAIILLGLFLIFFLILLFIGTALMSFFSSRYFSPF
jgi:hypothetical protein